MVIKEIFLSLMYIVTFLACSTSVDDDKKVSISINGLYSRQEMLSKDISISINPYSDTTKCYLILKIKNETDSIIILPCQKQEQILLYSPSKVKYYPNLSETKGGTAIIDCFNCDYFLKLKPSDSTQVYSCIPPICTESSMDKVILFYPYNLENNSTMTEFIEIEANINNCNVNQMGKYSIQRRVYKK